MTENNKSVLFNLIQQNSKVENLEINDHINLVNDLSFDSIDLMNLIVSIENEFGISFDIDDLDYEKIVYLNELESLIDTKLK